MQPISGRLGKEGPRVGPGHGLHEARPHEGSGPGRRVFGMALCPTSCQFSTPICHQTLWPASSSISPCFLRCTCTCTCSCSHTAFTSRESENSSCSSPPSLDYPQTQPRPGQVAGYCPHKIIVPSRRWSTLFSASDLGLQPCHLCQPMPHVSLGELWLQGKPDHGLPSTSWL